MDRRPATEVGLRLLCWAVIVVMACHFAIAIATTGIHQGLGTDVFFRGYAADVWQAGIDADLLAGLLLLAGWMVLRERHRVDAAAWIVLLFYWGNLVAAVYLLIQARRAAGRVDTLLLGWRAPVPPQPLPLSRAVGMLALLAAVAVSLWTVRLCWVSSGGWLPIAGYLGGFGSVVPLLLRVAHQRVKAS